MHMHHLAMVCAQELAEFGDISLVEKSVKEIKSIFCAFVNALLALV